MFTFTPIQGAQAESPASQSLLELDGGIKVLVGVGWDEHFDVQSLQELEKHIPTLSIVLLTHPTISHIGAFAHCCKHFPLFTKIPIYATQPVIALGRTLLQDLYTSNPLASTVIPPETLSESSHTYAQTTPTTRGSELLLQPPTNDEIAEYFKLINPLKYSQQHQPLPSPFSPPLNGLTITAYNAGHTLGGTIWHVQYGLESIVYAVDWNQARENVLAGAAWLDASGTGAGEVIEQLRKPTALICSSTGGARTALAGGKVKRDQLLLDMIRSAVNRGGVVLIPTDTCARVLELAYLLEHAWRADDQGESPFGTSRLYMASKLVAQTMSLTRSMLEWTNDAIIKELESSGDAKDAAQRGMGRTPGPFDFKHLKIIRHREQLDKILKETDNLGRSFGKVILANDSAMEWGFSKDLLSLIADDSRNLVILTERQVGAEGKATIGRSLWSWYEQRLDGVAAEQNSAGEILEQVYTGGRELEVRGYSRQPLADEDLAIYQQYLANQRQLLTTLQGRGGADLETSADVVDDGSSDSSSESDESDGEQQGRAINLSTTLEQANRKRVGISDEDLGVNILIRKKGVYDYDVREKKGRERMFPLPVHRRREDEFGELIRPEDFLRAEERDEVNMQGLSITEQREGLGKKRKWDDVATGADPRSGKRVNGESAEPDEYSGLSPDDDIDELPAEHTGPARLLVSSSMLKVNLRLAFVDFAGIHDKRSLQMLVPLIEPRKLILTGGNQAETLALAEDFRTLLAAKSGASERSGTDVYTPRIGESIDASVDTHAWVVKITDALVKRLRWQSIKDLSIVTVTGRLAAATGDPGAALDEASNKKRKLIKEETSDAKADAPADTPSPAPPQQPPPILDLLPSTMASATRSVAQPLHVGDLRLADLRKIMQAAGYTAEFRGEGTLLVNGAIVVRKSGTGRIELEGAGYDVDGGAGEHARSTFYAVRSKIYEGLAVVAGG